MLWACRGKTYAEISEIVGLSTGSVKTYLDAARHKLNVVNLPQACAVAVADGIFTRDEIMGATDRQEADRAAALDPANTPPPRQNQP